MINCMAAGFEAAGCRRCRYRVVRNHVSGQLPRLRKGPVFEGPDPFWRTGPWGGSVSPGYVQARRGNMPPKRRTEGIYFRIKQEEMYYVFK